MADRFEVIVLRHEQRIRELESQLRQLKDGGLPDELGSKKRPANGLYVGDRGIRGKVARLSYNSAAGTVKIDEV